MNRGSYLSGTEVHICQKQRFIFVRNRGSYLSGKEVYICRQTGLCARMIHTQIICYIYIIEGI